MKIITKVCKSDLEAIKHQRQLQEQYNSVKLVSHPYFLREGVYQWEVEDYSIIQ